MRTEPYGVYSILVNDYVSLQGHLSYLCACCEIAVEVFNANSVRLSRILYRGRGFPRYTDSIRSIE